MANLGFTVNADDLPQDQGSFDPVPAGEYIVNITEAGINDTKDGTGKYIKLRLDITGPSHEGRVLFSNLNIQNKSQKAEEIGRQQLGSVMRAIGLDSLQDTDQLVGGSMSVKVTIRQSDEYGPQNEVKSYKSAGGGSRAPDAVQGGNNNAPPWARK